MNEHDRRAILERRARFVAGAVAVVSGCGGSAARPVAPTPIAVAAPGPGSEPTEAAAPSKRERARSEPLPPLDVPSGIGPIARHVYESLAERAPRLHAEVDELAVPDACNLSEPECRQSWERHAQRLSELRHDFEALRPVCPGRSDEAAAAHARVDQHVRFGLGRLDEIERLSEERLAEWKELRASSPAIHPLVCLDCAIW